MLGFDGFLESAFLDPGDGPIDGTTSLYYSDLGYHSLPGDTLPNKTFPPRVNSVVLDRSIPIFPLTDSRFGTAVGEVVFNNEDGHFDRFPRQYAVDGRRVSIRRTSLTGSYDSALRVFDGVGSGWVLSETEAKLSVRDNIFRLDVPLVLSTIYTGAGGLGGGTDLTGLPEPVAFGRCRNIPLVLVDPTNLIYQFHNGSAEAVDEVRDRGVALTFAGDVADITATSVNPGEYKTQLSGGYVKLGATPDGLVTADIKGDNSDTGYINTVAAIIRRIIVDFVGLDPTTIDGASFEHVAGAHAAEVGIWIGPAVTMASAVINILLRNISGFMFPSRFGTYKLGYMKAPPSVPVTPKITLDTRHILGVRKLQLPPEMDPVIFRMRMGYQPLYITQDTDLAGAVTADQRSFYSKSFRSVAVADTGLIISYLTARDLPTIESTFESSTDAQTELDRLFGIWGVAREAFEVRVKSIGYAADLTDIAHITYDRFGLDAGEYTRIIGMREDFTNNEVALTVLL